VARVVGAGVLALLAGAPAWAQEHVDAGNVRVVYWQGQRGRAGEVLEIAAASMELPGIGRGGAPTGTTVMLAPDAAAFRALTGGQAPEWAGGIAIPEKRVIVLPGWASARAEGGSVKVIRHEVAHLALNAYVGHDVPRWFDEGYAEIASGGWDIESAWQLRLAMAAGRTPPLDSLALGWPRGAEQARMAYMLSATAVEFIRQRNGEAGFAKLLRNWRDEGTLEAAFRTTFATTTGHVEDEWREWVKLRFGWIQAITSSTVIWLALTLVVLFFWIPRRRRTRRILAEMVAEQRMLPPPRPELAGVEYPLSEPPPEKE